ncbi:MAG: transcriptional repressor [Nanoarchaeota archaeon]
MIIDKKKRMTAQRGLIIKYLKGVRSHPTAENVFRHVRKQMPSITLATVYRNLHLLAENSEIIRLNVNNEYHFDATTEMHQHFVCNSCRTIKDIDNCRISRYALNKIREENIPAEKVEIIFSGTCGECS